MLAKNAFAPFSKFQVGAALEDVDGRIHTGCNVENATYGLTVCAERVAVFKAISEGVRKFRRVAVAADTDVLTPPCGACRQILWEFCGDIEVIAGESARQDRNVPVERSLPEAIRCSRFCRAVLLSFCFRCCSRRTGRLDLERTLRHHGGRQRRVIENGAVAIRGDRIVAVGTRAEIDRAFSSEAAARSAGRDPSPA